MRSMVYLFANLALLALILVVVAVSDGQTDAEHLSASASSGISMYDGGRADRDRLFDYDYDDSWVEDFLDVIGGFEVKYIYTPKSRACLHTTIISLRSKQPTLDEYLAAPLDAKALREDAISIHGAPENFDFSFSPKPVDRLAAAAWEVDWNLKMIEHGCYERSGMIRRSTDNKWMVVLFDDNSSYDDAALPVFDYDYDDSWVESFPDVIGGFDVRYISTPKSMVCQGDQATLYLRSNQLKEDEFMDTLGDGDDREVLREAILSVPGVPSKIRVAFSPEPVDREAFAGLEADWNLKRGDGDVCGERWSLLPGDHSRRIYIESGGDMEIVGE